MSLLRTAGRTMLASYFIVHGAKAAWKPDALVADMEPVAARMVPLAQRVAPASVASYIPDDTKALVRCVGLSQVAGGLALATGLGRRLGAGVLALTAIPSIAAAWPTSGMTREEKRDALEGVVRQAALLGGTLIACQDTQGQPSLSWRLRAKRSSQAKKADKKADKKQHRQAARRARTPLETAS